MSSGSFCLHSHCILYLCSCGAVEEQPVYFLYVSVSFSIKQLREHHEGFFWSCPQDSHMKRFFALSVQHLRGAVPFPGTVDGGEWSLCGRPSGGFWEVLFLLADNTGRSSWSVSLAQSPLCSPRHLSEGLIIHEHLKSFQFIKHLSSNSPVGSMKNMVLHCFLRLNRPGIIFFTWRHFISPSRIRNACLPR